MKAHPRTWWPAGALLMFLLHPQLLFAASARVTTRVPCNPDSSPISFPGEGIFEHISGIMNVSCLNRTTWRPAAPMTQVTTLPPAPLRPSVEQLAPLRPSVEQLAPAAPWQQVAPVDTQGGYPAAINQPNVKPTSPNGSPYGGFSPEESPGSNCRREQLKWSVVSPFQDFSTSYRLKPSATTQTDTRPAVDTMFKMANSMESLMIKSKMNLAYSPVSLTTTLGQLMLAARGRTLEELENLLVPGEGTSCDGRANRFHSYFQALLSLLLKRSGSQSYELSGRNALFYQQPGEKLNAEFTRRLKGGYTTEIFPVDFRLSYAQDHINTWAREASQGKINQLVPHTLPRNTRAIISSVTFFKAEWEKKFNKQFTSPGPFYLEGDHRGPVKNVDFMSGEFELAYAENRKLGCRIVAMPYTNNETAMYFIMPLGPPKRKPAPPTVEVHSGTTNQHYQVPSQGGNSAVNDLLRSSFNAPNIQTQHQNYGTWQTTTAFSANSFFYRGAHSTHSAPDPATSHHTTNVRGRSRRQDSGGRSSETPQNESPFSPANLHKLASRLGAEEFNSLVVLAKRNDPIRVSLIIPKLSMATSVRLKEALVALGVNSVFGESADLTGGIDNTVTPASNNQQEWKSGAAGMRSQWAVDEVWEQSRLDVNEDGTEAVSATAAGIVDYSLDSIVFKANSPFLSILRHEQTGTPIFWASVVDPL